MNELPNPLTRAERAYWDHLLRQSLKARRDADRVLRRMQRDALKRSKVRQ